MAEQYITISGDVWDGIAKKVYGDEMYTSFLMEKNQRLLEYFVFPAGVTLQTPEKPQETGTLPDWRT